MCNTLVYSQAPFLHIDPYNMAVQNVCTTPPSLHVYMHTRETVCVCVFIMGPLSVHKYIHDGVQ